jgi:mono/diheme cytochrome c family protein
MFVILASATADSWAADAMNGAAVLTREECNACHTIHGQGMGHEPPAGTRAPDLAESVAAASRPAALASALWNHAPDMWREMPARGASPPSATDAEWQDVFAYLYSLRFAENPAQFSRGKTAFGANCSACHSEALPKHGPGKPISGWAPVNDPVSLVWQMWNHAATMNKSGGEASKPWPILTGQDFLDITAWLQNVQKLAPERSFAMPEPATGRLAYAENCQTCHTGSKALEATVSGQSFMDLGAGMWNHAPLMKLHPMPETEMRGVLAWVWQLQYAGPKGNIANGQQVFEGAGCISCHRSPADGAPLRPQSREQITPFSMVALGWGDARQMHLEMIKKGTAWPRLSPDDMNDLVAYLNTLPK